jgi:hypothetical protein
MIRTSSALVLLSPATAVAHPGHGVAGMLHYLAEPMHLLPLLAGTALLWLAVRRYRKTR